MDDLDMLPNEAKDRILELIANEEKGVEYKTPIGCENIAAYVCGYAHTPEIHPTDEILIHFANRPDNLLKKKSTEDPKSGDLAVFFYNDLPQHFAVYLGNDEYFSKIGQAKISFDDSKEIHEIYLTDRIAYFKGMY